MPLVTHVLFSLQIISLGSTSAPYLPSKIHVTDVNIFAGCTIWAPAGTGIGCRVYSSTNTSPCVSSRKHRTKRPPICVSRPPPTSSLACSCFSAVSALTMWAFGPRQRYARLRRTARRSGRRSSALMRCAHPIARCSACWNGVGWKLCRAYQDSGAAWLFFLFPPVSCNGIHVRIDIY